MARLPLSPLNVPPDPPTQQQQFVWPPRPTPQTHDGRPEPHTPRASPSPATPRSWWEHAEHEWLGVTTPPLTRRLADAGAAPDPLNAFCWRCARTVGPYETDARGCAYCRDARPPWHRFIRLAEYTHPWSGLIWDAKFTRWPRLANDLGRLLGCQIAAALPDLHARSTIVVPVPTNLWRRLTRGTDHSLNIARGVGSGLSLPVRQLLTRSRRPEQARLPATQRATNLRNAMSRARLDAVWSAARLTPAARWPAPGIRPRVILVDDISTTGATMREACRAVRQIGKRLSINDLEIVCAVVCRTEERR